MTPPTTDQPVEIRLACAAVHFDDGQHYVHQPPNISTGIVVCGLRHCNCFNTFAALTERRKTDFVEVEQGFLTDRGYFANRIVGLELAIASGQIVHKHSPKDELMSEDMW